MTFPLDFSSLYTSTAQSGQSSANGVTLVFKPLIPLSPILYHLPLLPHHRLLLLAVSLHLLLPRNAGGPQARSTEFLHFRLSHPVDLICIQESNHNSSSSHRIPGFSTLRSDRTHSRSSILSPDAMHVSGGVTIFVRQGLSFSELSTSFLSSLDPYPDYVGVNISLKTPLSFIF